MVAQDKVEWGVLTLESTNALRDIKEFPFTGSAFQDFRVKDDSRPLGNHFHQWKFEVFYVIEGGGTVKTAAVDEQGRISGEVKEFCMEAGSVIYIPPRHTHRFDLRTGTRFVAFSSEKFDPADMTSCPIE